MSPPGYYIVTVRNISEQDLVRDTAKKINRIMCELKDKNRNERSPWNHTDRYNSFN